MDPDSDEMTDDERLDGPARRSPRTTFSKPNPWNLVAKVQLANINVRRAEVERVVGKAVKAFRSNRSGS